MLINISEAGIDTIEGKLSSTLSLGPKEHSFWLNCSDRLQVLLLVLRVNESFSFTTKSDETTAYSRCGV